MPAVSAQGRGGGLAGTFTFALRSAPPAGVSQSHLGGELSPTPPFPRLPSCPSLPLSLPPFPRPFLSRCAPARPPLRPPPGTQRARRRVSPWAQDPDPGSPPDGGGRVPRLLNVALLLLCSQLSPEWGAIPWPALLVPRNPAPRHLPGGPSQPLLRSLLLGFPLPAAVLSSWIRHLPFLPLQPRPSLCLPAASSAPQGLRPGPRRSGRQAPDPPSAPWVSPAPAGGQPSLGWVPAGSEREGPEGPRAPLGARGRGARPPLPRAQPGPGGRAGCQPPGRIKMTDAGEEGTALLCLKRAGLVERKS